MNTPTPRLTGQICSSFDKAESLCLTKPAPLWHNLQIFLIYWYTSTFPSPPAFSPSRNPSLNSISSRYFCSVLFRLPWLFDSCMSDFGPSTSLLLDILGLKLASCSFIDLLLGKSLLGHREKKIITHVRTWEELSPITSKICIPSWLKDWYFRLTELKIISTKTGIIIQLN